MHADRTNRTMLLLLGALLTAAGAGALLTALGVFGTTIKHKHLFTNFISAFIGRNGHWLWPVTAIICALIVLACLRWILALLASTDRAGTATLPGDKTHGRTTITTTALTTALTTELETYRGVTHAKARLIGNDNNPDLIVTITATNSTNIRALRDRIENHALNHARRATNRPDLPIQLDINTNNHTIERTH